MKFIYGSMKELMADVEKNSLPSVWHHSPDGMVTKVMTAFGEMLIYISAGLIDICPKRAAYWDGYPTVSWRNGKPEYAVLLVYNAKGWIKKTTHLKELMYGQNNLSSFLP